jgi:hypothetical protein
MLCQPKYIYRTARGNSSTVRARGFGRLSMTVVFN